MEEMKLNETPVRTSRNFNINNIKLENINIPAKSDVFENVQIIKESSKVDISENASKAQLAYGLNKELIENVNENSNKNIRIMINSKTENTSKLYFKFDKSNQNLIENVEIVAMENTKATVILKYESEENEKFYHNGIIRVNAERGSNVNVIIVNLINTVSNNFLAIENVLENDSKLKYTIIDFGGKSSITNYYSNLLGSNSDNTLNTIYLGKENQLFDLNYIGELRGEKSNIDIEVQGALKDTAIKHFKGTIDFKKGCKKATGNENENCMLLSDKAKSVALPMLLCSEEDVEGNHSTSSGKIGEKELFYIMSRGFSLKEAQKLMVRAKFNKILENVKDEELKQEIFDEIDNRLD